MVPTLAAGRSKPGGGPRGALLGMLCWLTSTGAGWEAGRVGLPMTGTGATWSTRIQLSSDCR